MVVAGLDQACFVGGIRAGLPSAVVYCWCVDTREAAQRWAEVWERGWREHDAAAIAALYAEGAFWQQHPFREPEPGYLARVFAEESRPSAGSARRSSTAIRRLCPGARRPG